MGTTSLIDEKYELQRKIIDEARTWIDTPHKHNQALKGVGVDCVRFPYEVAIACGIELEKSPGNYNRDPEAEYLLDRLHEELILVGTVRESRDNWSQKYLKRAMPRLDLLELLKPGDILVYKRTWFGEPGHLGLFLGASIIQTYVTTGVRETGVGHERLLCAAFRFKELV